MKLSRINKVTLEVRLIRSKELSRVWQLEQSACQISPRNMQRDCGAQVTVEGEFFTADLNAKILMAFTAIVKCITGLLGNENTC